jgi:hypothetical protein
LRIFKAGNDLDFRAHAGMVLLGSDRIADRGYLLVVVARLFA